jgi:hypothetical protein
VRTFSRLFNKFLSHFAQLPDSSAQAPDLSAIVLSSATIASAAAIAQTFKSIDDAHEAKGMHRRGALLAQIDLYSSLVGCGDPSSAADASATVADVTLELIQQFITRFSTLSSCALDISPYLLRLTPQLLRRLLQQLLLLPSHVLASTEDLNSCDSPAQLARRCTSVCSVNRITAMAQSRLEPVAPYDLSMPRLLQVCMLRAIQTCRFVRDVLISVFDAVAPGFQCCSQERPPSRAHRKIAM